PDVPAPPAPELIMPDLSSPDVPAPPTPELIMPDLVSPDVPAPPAPEFIMPDLVSPDVPAPPTPEFIMPDLASPERSAPTVPPAATGDKCLGSGSNRLEGAILMYLPHGVELKLDILKSLLSMRYSVDLVGREVKQMEDSGIISIITKEGNTYLIRR
ncbi:MAG: hypothetical protein K8R64_03495, partial [Methanosarcinaceae archaeon]|nr:hypothetical protein [Methanosarcinaceae archaeon]